jgi:ABC-type ATPase involved in cell division
LARALLAQPDLLVIDDVAGVLDDDARRLVRVVLEEHHELCIAEATVDTPLLTSATTRIGLGP